VLVMTASPQRIVLGGGVLQRKTLVTKVRAQLKRQLGGYVTHDLVSSKRGLVEFVGAFIFGNFLAIFWQFLAMVCMGNFTDDVFLCLQ
jgi:fructokinase